MRLKNYLYAEDHILLQLSRLIKSHLSITLEDIIGSTKELYYLKKSGKLAGYVIFIYKGVNVTIEWIHVSQPGKGYGKLLMKKLEKKFRGKGIRKISLNLSIDPGELKKTVVRRINFYISLNYRVKDIKYRKNSGVLLDMYKPLKN